MIDEAVLDGIYEAALMPEAWPRALDAVAALGGAAGTILFVTDQSQISRWTASACFVSVMEAWVGGGWGARSQRVPRMIGLRHPGFVTEHDLYRDDELDADPSYTDFLRPRGMGWGAGAFVPLPSGGAAVFSVERRLEAGPMSRGEVARLDAIRPHLARSALMAARMGLERARTAMAILDRLSLPAALLHADGRVLLANAQLDEATAYVVARAHGRIGLPSSRAQALFQSAVAASRGSEAARSIPLAAREGHGPAILHLLPLRRSAQDLFAGGALLMVLTRLTNAPLPEISLLEGLFDLTPSEAKLAAALCAGSTIDGTAAELGLSRETLRTQLKRVFAKTGTGRQAELVNLLGGLKRPY
ncbi:helix-turn-helix transcriptional regulator [Methylobacterium radiodurans]|uniref:HTH luxR-type domain-containing protein n=1 Tax=Methylobacterium radiodurans TaxID=2202828 RepID=A0A2U8VRP5_9HYPH|nr:hypothetical protein [Methylobacterium radiodurans]AWN36373.1 hypothetical protein DK427_12075 [Methylobacterium radiodurans]